MWLLQACVILGLFQGSRVFAQQTLYVRPTDLQLQECPGQPCCTLEQYGEQADKFFTTGATFLFLPGNHTLHITISLINISAITFKKFDNASIVMIICNTTILICNSIKNLTIDGLNIQLHCNSSKTFSALKVYYSTGIQIFQSLFQGSRKLKEIGLRAVRSTHSVIIIMNCLFDGNKGHNGGALLAASSNITLTANTFTQNKGDNGGVLFADRCNVSLNGNTFTQNQGINGGALFAVRSDITLNGNTFTHNKARRHGGGICAYISSLDFDSELHNKPDSAVSGELHFKEQTKNNNKSICDRNNSMCSEAGLYFYNEARCDGGAVYLYDSSAQFSGRVFQFIHNTADNGGAIYIKQDQILAYLTFDVEYLYFIGNKAPGDLRAGGIWVESATLYIGAARNNNHYFFNNLPLTIMCANNTAIITGNNIFMNNGLNTTAGGAIRTLFSNLTLMGNMTFHLNLAELGGAIFVEDSNVIIDGTIVEFKFNKASEGGGIYNKESNLSIKADKLYFKSNYAKKLGGAIAMSNYHEDHQIQISGNFTNNTAECGGAVSAVGEHNITFVDITATGNSMSALCFASSAANFTGTTRITNNSGTFGGGINSKDSFLVFTNSLQISYNQAVLGGGIYCLYGELNFENMHLGRNVDEAQFAYNMASRDGGALYATSSTITLKTLVQFAYNSAQNGGVVYLKTAARLMLQKRLGAMFRTSHNQASEFGGVIYNEDSAALIQCGYEPEEVGVDQLPHCPLQLNIADFVSPATSYLNSARRGGKFMYGGLLDRCRLDQTIGSSRRSAFTFLQYLDVFSSVTNLTSEIASSPYQLCFCENNTLDCSGERNLSIYRGQSLRVSLIAFDQTETTVSTLVTATLLLGRLGISQSPQFLTQNCSDLTYNVFSTKRNEQLTLYPEGPCQDNGLAGAVINLTLLPCPDAFNRSSSGEQCECEDRLINYGAQCVINDKIYIIKQAGSMFWMSTLRVKGKYQGLILYKTCPLEYCKKTSVNITLKNLDIQCDHNRSGVLCGECKPHHSILLGSFQCQVCSNINLTLLLGFIAAGIALVFSLSILRLTVATGMLNSVILYANIVQANKAVFFVNNEQSIFSVFIAWMNLDLGFQSCFYNGMDAHAQTWLQFAFPLYIWILISLIILISRYSITMSKLIGHNPIAVLATLLLMSYAKLLKIIIEVYSSVDLDYPDNKKVTVWLKDANVPYLRSKHLALAIVTSLMVMFFFLPYTFLLLAGYKLYRYSGRKYFRWFNTLKPLMDSYNAPYKISTRYWTGFLLLVRCALYIVFSFGTTNINLLLINVTFTLLIIVAWLSVQIYEKFCCNLIEASVYLNLIILASATLAGTNTPTFINLLMGTVLVTMVGIGIYHFHLTYTAKSAMWLFVIKNVTSVIETVKTSSTSKIGYTPLNHPALSPVDSERIISKSVINLREPLMEQ